MNDFFTNSENLTVAEFAATELAAAGLLAELNELNRGDSAHATPIISEEDAAAYLAHDGVSEIRNQVDYELAKARVGQGRWKEMKLDLKERPGCGIFPIDYCPEITPERTSYYKDRGKADLVDSMFPPPFGEIAEVLGIPLPALVKEHRLSQVNRYLDKFADRVRLWTAMGEAFGRAIEKQARIKHAARTELNRIARQDLLPLLKAEKAALIPQSEAAHVGAGRVIH